MLTDVGATHTLLRIFDAYGDRLSPEAWSICIKSVIFKLMTSVAEELRSVSGPNVNEKERTEWHDTAVVVLNGISGLLANYLDVLTVHPTFNSYWQQLLGHFATLLDFQVLDINTATFKALTQILSQSQNGAKQNFNKTTIDLAWDLWARGIPMAKGVEGAKPIDNQNCLLAYVAALRDVYRLIQADLDVERVRRMLTLLREAMQQATPGAYVADIDYVTPLQGQILDVLKMIRTDLPGVPSALISQAAEFVSLAFTDENVESQRSPQKRTYVAMSKAGTLILESLIVSHASDRDIYCEGAFLAALKALAKPIELKYQFPILTKSTQPWKMATTSALAVLEATLQQLRILDIPRAMLQDIWHVIVTIANGITEADCNVPPERVNLEGDQDFDVVSFGKLRELIIPSLGAEVIPDTTRQLFAESLFRMSILHAPAPAESVLIYGGEQGGSSSSPADGLASLVYQPRAGRTVDPSPALRKRMAYVCLDELFALVASHDAERTPSISVQPPTPAFAPPAGQPSSTNPGGTSSSTSSSEAPHALHVRLARTTAPYLILRSALALRAYVADQPLRGRMPQPHSQRAELRRILTRLTELRSEADALPPCHNVDSDARKHLLRLYPLLVQAAGVAGRGGDAEVGGMIEAALNIVGGELGL